MERTTSRDGTVLAYERRGNGPALVIVGGAFNDRRTWTDLAEALAPSFTAVTYDRRGRGDSSDTKPYAVEREIEDLDAVIEVVGGEAFVHSHSSGAALALRAVAAGAPVPALCVFEPPYRTSGAPPAPPRYVETLIELTRDGPSDEAVVYFMTVAVGLGPQAVDQARTQPRWPGLVAMSPTLVYDGIVMGDQSVPTELLGSVRTPTLAACSNGSAPWLQAAARAVAGALSGSRLVELEGEFHRVPPDTMAAALGDFFFEAVG
jgi:pimeloyl-ACP methyl ester carboxylesterase